MSVSILTGSVLTSFADLVNANSKRIYRLWIVAPWIGYSTRPSDALSRVVDTLRGSRSKLIVITRKPDSSWHLRAVDVLRTYPHREIFYCASLHTKLYILECDGFRAAILGSPNLTPAADLENREIAIEFRTTRQGRDEPTGAIVGELITYASSLRNEEDVRPID